MLDFVARARSLGFPIEDCRGRVALRGDHDRSSADVGKLVPARLVRAEPAPA